ncbi:cell adhesion molecule CEACAM16-like [Pyxicephalus adspersus]
MISKQNQLSLCVIVSVLLSMWMDVASGTMSIQPIPQNPIIGGSVTLSVIGITGRIQTFSWFKGSTNSNNQFLAYFPGQNPPLTTGPLYHDRLEAFPNGSLRISNLIRSDEGNYIVKIQADKSSDIPVDLKIYELVVKPNITASTSLPKENDTVTLTCTSTNAERIEWSRVPIGATRSPDNKTVTFSRINRSDSGDYSCTAINPVDKKNSDLIKITVAYGPENVKIKALSLTDSLISLECSADSVPEASFHWTLNGTDFNIKQNLIQVDRKKAGNEGIYTCVAKNSVTQFTATEFIYVNSTFEPPADLESRTNPSTIIGIVTGSVILLLVLVAALVYLFVIHRRRKKPLADKTSTIKSNSSSRMGQTNPSVLEPEVQYADVVFSKNMPKKPQPTPESLYSNTAAISRPPEVVYSELRRN